jgi:hypothetical protein
MQAPELFEFSEDFATKLPDLFRRNGIAVSMCEDHIIFQTQDESSRVFLYREEGGNCELSIADIHGKALRERVAVILLASGSRCCPSRPSSTYYRLIYRMPLGGTDAWLSSASRRCDLGLPR